MHLNATFVKIYQFALLLSLQSCKKILGCELCVNHWYSGDEALTKSCPACHADRGYNETILLRGLDEFWIGVRQAIQTEDERDEEEIPAVTVD